MDPKCCPGAHHWILEQAFRILIYKEVLVCCGGRVQCVFVLRRELRGKSFLGMGDQTAMEGAPGHRNIGCRAEKVGGSGVLAEQWRKGIWRV